MKKKEAKTTMLRRGGGRKISIIPSPRVGKRHISTSGKKEGKKCI